jgi:nucleoside recognition membrane protein YjiH
LIYIWWMLSLAIGLGVLYRKRTGPIATTMLAVYAVIGVIIAAIKTASTGV